MHPAVERFVAECVFYLPERGSVLDLGGRDANGSVRSLFSWAEPYVILDNEPGPDVDVVADAITWSPDYQYDIVVCTEVLEHVANWRAIIDICYAALAPGGTLILTCATTNRGPHDSHGAPNLPPDQYYGNVSMAEFATHMENRWAEYDLRQTVGCDLQFRGVKPGILWTDNPGVRWRYP